MKKKILVIEQHFYPEVAATGQLLLDLCEDLVNAGHQVKVITGNPTEIYHKKINIPRKDDYLNNKGGSNFSLNGCSIIRSFDFTFFFNSLKKKCPEQ